MWAINMDIWFNITAHFELRFLWMEFTLIESNSSPCWEQISSLKLANGENSLPNVSLYILLSREWSTAFWWLPVVTISQDDTIVLI